VAARPEACFLAYRLERFQGNRRGARQALSAKVVPSFYLRLHAAVANAFGDMKTAEKVHTDINQIRAAGAGYQTLFASAEWHECRPCDGLILRYSCFCAPSLGAKIDFRVTAEA
jgi:hypothetical protein